jgi:uncharacterized membrane protein
LADDPHQQKEEVMNRKILFEIVLWVLIIAPLIHLWAVWDRLPAQVAVHWNIHGEPDGWSDRSTLPWLIGGMGVGMYLLMLVIPYLDPRKRNLQASSRSYQHLRVVFQLLFAFIGFGSVRGGLVENFDVGTWFMPVLFLFLAAVGNYMHSLRSNYFIGIRTPWTLEYPEIWERTHRLGGRLWFWMGFIGAIGAFFIRGNALPVWMISLIAIMVLVPAVYSFVLFKKGVGRKAQV